MTSKVLVEQKLQSDLVSQNFDLKSANTKQKQKNNNKLYYRIIEPDSRQC